MIGPHDVPATDGGAKVDAALRRFALAEAADAAAFDVGFEALDAVFGPRGENERREVLEAWFAGPRTPPEGWPARVRCSYHLVLARDLDRGGELAGVRDCFVTVDATARRCISLLSHVLVLPAYRRTGLAALLRAAPIGLCRRAAAEAGMDPATVEITLFAEMEPVTPEEADTVVRLLAYGRSGFRVIPPAIFPYLQPDFRDLDALGAEALPMPLIAMVRQVGEEGRSDLPRARAEACLRHIHAIHASDNRPADIAVLQRHTARALAAFSGEVVPLLPLPSGDGALAAIAPLVRSAVLACFPEPWRRGQVGDPDEERAAIAARWQGLS